MSDEVTIALRGMKFVVSDIDGVTEFYKKAFGFELTNTIKLGEITEHVLNLPGSELGLVLVRHGDEPVVPGTSYGPLVIDTNDVKALVDAAVAAGGTLTMGPLELPSVVVAMVDDPEGHPLELLHMPTGEIDFDSLKIEDLVPNEPSS
jgi:predicted enzyme related to lactoylglutathione lyase